MSIQFDPKNQTSVSANNMQTPPEPKLSFLQKWVNSVYDGCLKERLHPQTYCERVWVQQTGTSSEQATKVFMQKCTDDCIAYKSYCRWSRLN